MLDIIDKFVALIDYRFIFCVTALARDKVNGLLAIRKGFFLALFMVSKQRC